MRNKSTVKFIIVILFSLLLTNFWGATAINNTILLLPVIAFVIMELSKKGEFKGYLIILLVGLFLNMISCYYFNGQQIFYSFRGSSMFFYILFYFMLKNINISIPEMEKALIVLTIFFCICYIIQFIIYPVAIFSGAEVEYHDDVRIRLAGQGFSSLGYFFGLNKYLKTKKTSYLFLSILCFGIIFLMGFRTMLVMTVIFTFVMIIRVNGFNWKLLFSSALICGIFVILLQIPVFADKINGMLERQETQVLTNPNYIRIIQLQYYTQQHFKSFWEFIFGSGYPSINVGGETSAYSRYMFGLTNMGINWSDWGLISLSWVIGIPAVLVMITYSIKAARLKVASDYYYLGIWFLYLIFSSVTTAEFFRRGNFVVQAFALYMVEKVYKEYLSKRI